MSRTDRTASEPPADAVTDQFDDEATTRDRVWDATLALLSTRRLPFQAWRVRRRAGLDDSADRTIRRTLSAMEAAGWLEHEDGSPWWYPGEKAADRFNMEYPHLDS